MLLWRVWLWNKQENNNSIGTEINCNEKLSQKVAKPHKNVGWIEIKRVIRNRFTSRLGQCSRRWRTNLIHYRLSHVVVNSCNQVLFLKNICNHRMLLIGPCIVDTKDNAAHNEICDCFGCLLLTLQTISLFSSYFVLDFIKLCTFQSRRAPSRSCFEDVQYKMEPIILIIDNSSKKANVQFFCIALTSYSNSLLWWQKLLVILNLYYSLFGVEMIPTLRNILLWFKYLWRMLRKIAPSWIMN